MTRAHTEGIAYGIIGIALLTTGVPALMVAGASFVLLALVAAIVILSR